MLFPNRHLSQRQVLNFSIKSDEAWEVVNTIMVRLKKKLKSQNYMRIIAKIYKIILILDKFIQKLPLWTLLVDVFYYLFLLDKLHYNWMSTLKRYFTITLLYHLHLPFSQTHHIWIKLLNSNIMKKSLIVMVNNFFIIVKETITSHFNSLHYTTHDDIFQGHGLE
jgi:hypothetical protein